jgi:hypothetical protein
MILDSIWKGLCGKRDCMNDVHTLCALMQFFLTRTYVIKLLPARNDSGNGLTCKKQEAANDTAS